MGKLSGRARRISNKGMPAAPRLAGRPIKLNTLRVGGFWRGTALLYMHVLNHCKEGVGGEEQQLIRKMTKNLECRLRGREKGHERHGRVLTR